MRNLMVAALVAATVALAPHVVSAAANPAQSLVGKTFQSSSGAILSYGRNGSYTYTSSSGRVIRGTYIVGRGFVCVTSPGMSGRCDRIVRKNGGLVLINGRGEEYTLTPVRRR